MLVPHPPSTAMRGLREEACRFLSSRSFGATLDATDARMGGNFVNSVQACNNGKRVCWHQRNRRTFSVVATQRNGIGHRTTQGEMEAVPRRHFTSLNQSTPFQLCFLRHGQSTWNRDNIFIGWTDTPLTDDGVLEARVAGKMLHKSGIRFDEVHTSLLRRSIRTTNLALMELGQEYLPVHKHWRLNERCYGDLVGKNKKEVVMQHGADQVKRWRRSYDEPPPPMSDDHPYHPARDPRYQNILDELPKSESLKNTVERSSLYWDEVLAPALREGKTLLVVGHENNLRSLLMRLEDIAPEDIINLSLPRAVPLAYRLDENLKPLPREDGKLDEATGFLKGTWLGGDQAVSEILDRDHKQVYDTAITTNLEIGQDREKWNNWMEFIMGKPSAKQKRIGGDKQNGFAGGATIPGVNHRTFTLQQERKQESQ
jgi:2,3-bisphosphoglycerate-dependent phosphoglycerate mutase